MPTTSGTYPWSFVTQIFHNGQPSFKVVLPSLPTFSHFKSLNIEQSKKAMTYATKHRSFIDIFHLRTGYLNYIKQSFNFLFISAYEFMNISV